MLMAGILKILPLQGRWLAAGQTEGCRPLDNGTPLHHRFAMVLLPLQGRILRIALPGMIHA